MHSDERLWVDRYKPKKFLDLLGDEVCVHIGPITPNNTESARESRNAWLGEGMGPMCIWEQHVETAETPEGGRGQYYISSSEDISNTDTGGLSRRISPPT
jgi:hypothetical protein